MIQNTKRRVILLIILLFVFGGCEENILTSGSQPVGTLVGYEGCKTFATNSSLDAVSYANTQECIEYDYDGESILRLNHINAGFNCCPGEIEATISVSDNMIVIADREEEQGCFCQCLFDLQYEILELGRGEYTLAITGPYIQDTDEQLLFNLQLAGPISGTFCVNRTHYPWGLDD
ncbi:MAG: hypothetical protein PVH84_12755 [Candidatus Aminicenantes bacterium]|jgi:hypothetical protein